MKHLMIDLETMGKKSDAPIVAIGAVFFEPETGALGPEFSITVNLKDALESGAEADGDTILWWLGQADEARAAISSKEALKAAVSLLTALDEFTNFIVRNTDSPEDLNVWGNGATFDNVIIRRSYDRLGLVTPWRFTGDCDVRTIVMLGRQLGFNPKRDLPFTGERHTALADAIHQAQYVSAIWQRLFLNDSPPVPDEKAALAIYDILYQTEADLGYNVQLGHSDAKALGVWISTILKLREEPANER